MSDLAAAAAALGAPEAIVKRSAEARAKASGASVDDILNAWAGGGAAPAPAAPPPEADAPPVAAATEPAPEERPAPIAPVDVPLAPAPAAAVIEAEEPLEPEPLRARIRVAGRIGLATGALLGVLGWLVSSPWLLPNASIVGEEGDFSPAFLVDRGRVVLVTALLSLVFGAVVAALSRTITGWLSPANALVGRVGLQALAGAGLGLILGVAAGAVLNSFGLPVEGAENLIQLPVVPAMVVVVLGGALLGWLTAAAVQVVGVPAGVGEHEAGEVAAVQRRLGGAIGVPLAGLVALAVLVLPLALVLIESAHLSELGAPVLAIIASASILAFASLSASKPGMKISRGEFGFALGGIAVLLMIVMAVLLARNPPAHEEEATEASPTTTTISET